MKPYTAEWFVARPQTLGSSEAAAAIGVSPWETRAQLALRKIAARHGQWREQPDTAAMERGRILEDVIARAYKERRGVELLPSEYRRSHVRPWQSATIDRLIVGQPQPEIIEIKTAAGRDGWGEPGTDQIPMYYLVQVLHQLAVFTEFTTARVVVLWGHHHTLAALSRVAQQGENAAAAVAKGIADEIAEYVIRRDETAVASLVSAEERFWRDWVEAQTIHEIDGEEETRRRLAMLYPRAGKSVIRGGDAETIAMRRLVELRKQAAAVEEEIGKIQNMLCQRIGAAAGISTDIGTLFWREVAGRKKTDWDAIAKECGIPAEVIDRHTTRGEPSRRVEFRAGEKEE